MMMNKKLPWLYYFGRAILGPIFRWYYKPLIIGKENIPREGAIVIVGNHIKMSIISENSSLLSYCSLVTIVASTVSSPKKSLKKKLMAQIS